MVQDARRLIDLVSVGPAALRDFAQLGIRSVRDLAGADPEELYVRLCKITGKRHDPCVVDAFQSAVAQARDPQLPAERKQWWYWSRLRSKTSVDQSRSAPCKVVSSPPR